MPKESRPLGALKRLEEAQAKQGMMYGIQRLGLPDAEGRQTILGMDPYNKSRTRYQAAKPGEVEKQIALLQKQAAIAKAKKDTAAEKKVMDELSALMASAPMGAELGPPRDPSFRADYERITNVPYEETIGRARKSRKGKKKGGKKTRKGGKSRRH
jgi:hypothetical protein